ncbi:MAG: hypothetical protein ACRCTR_09870 [Actinomycetota bacterium]
MATLVDELPGVLAPGGIGQLLAAWEHHDGDWQERVASWIPAGVDAWVVQRDIQDPASYAHLWATDGGHHPGTSAFNAMVRRWLDDFADRQVEAIGFGVITIRRPVRSGRSSSFRRVEEIFAPTTSDAFGSVVTEMFTAHDRWVDCSNGALLASRLTVASSVTESRLGLPGAADPTVIHLIHEHGVRRVMAVESALAGLVGACDGSLTVSQIVDALAVLTDESVEDLQLRLLPAVRSLLADGVLTDGG